MNELLNGLWTCLQPLLMLGLIGLSLPAALLLQLCCAFEDNGAASDHQQAYAKND
jgi:hypothetical protein